VKLRLCGFVFAQHGQIDRHRGFVCAGGRYSFLADASPEENGQWLNYCKVSLNCLQMTWAFSSSRLFFSMLVGLSLEESSNTCLVMDFFPKRFTPWLRA